MTCELIERVNEHYGMIDLMSFLMSVLRVSCFYERFLSESWPGLGFLSEAECKTHRYC